MNFGAFFPQSEIGNDPGVIREFAQTAETLGFDYIAASDHVVGANPKKPGWEESYYTVERPFHEPFVLLGFLAGVTRTIGLSTSIVILPQRPTVLVAKQAAELDVLSGGRLRLGVGLGWNAIEFEALNQNFRDRARRFEEQITLLRQLWTQPVVEFKGQWHSVPDAGLNPRPVQRPIPLWLGGYADAALQRIARIADGWVGYYDSPEKAQPSLRKLDQFLTAAGRSREGFGVEMVIRYGEGQPEAWRSLIAAWQTTGVTHLSFNTLGAELRSPAEHLTALSTFAEAVGIPRHTNTQ